jgi:hypothetical protein
MKERHDHHTIVVNSIDQAILEDEELTNVVVPDFGNHAAAISQRRRALRPLEDLLQYPNSAVRRIASDVAENLIERKRSRCSPTYSA